MIVLYKLARVVIFFGYAQIFTTINKLSVGSPTVHIFNRTVGGVMVKPLDCRIAVSEFGLQSRYYVHFWTNTLGKGMNLLILPAMG